MKQQGDWQTYLTRVLLMEETGVLPFLLRSFLSVLAFIYFILLCLSRFLQPRRRLPVPVISVGNITLGGTGKTPTVVWLVRLLKQEGLTPAVLTRGYHGAAQNEGVCFTGSDLEDLNPDKTGDEPFLLAKLLPDTLIVVGKDRYRMAQQALKTRPGIDLFILDDGFQHRPLFRDLDIVLIDATRPFGNGHLLPRGFLREPLTGLKRAGILLLTRTAKVSAADLDRLKGKLKKFNPWAEVASVTENNRYLLPLPGLNSGALDAESFLPGRKVAAITGIGQPRQFLASLENFGAEVAYFRAFPDHYFWEGQEIRDLIAGLAGNGFQELIVTAKDGVKLERFAGRFSESGLTCYILSLDFSVEDPRISAKIKAVALGNPVNNKRL